MQSPNVNPVIGKSIQKTEPIMLDINFGNDLDMYRLLGYYNHLGQEALFMNHYELAERTGESPILWKQFITNPKVSTFIAEELELLKKSKVAVMLKDIDENKSTGQAQLLNTLLNQTKGSEVKEGPVFIYTHVPLNDNERHAGNVVIINENNDIENSD